MIARRPPRVRSGLDSRQSGGWYESLQRLTLDLSLQGTQVSLVHANQALLIFTLASDLLADLLRLFLVSQSTYPVAGDDVFKDGKLG